ncbi:IclR family transcriptional regulator [Leucobacter sp. GX24907]
MLDRTADTDDSDAERTSAEHTSANHSPTDQTPGAPRSTEDNGTAHPAEGPNRSVARAVALLRELGNHRGGATAAVLAASTGLNRATAFRLLLSLTQSGIITRSGSTFALGWEITRLGRLADPYRSVLPLIQAVLERLSAQVNEHVAFSAALDALTLEVIAEADSPNDYAFRRSFMGMKFPLHAGGNGKVLLAEMSDDQVVKLVPETLEKLAPKTITSRAVLLAELAQVRARGYATIDNESEEGLFAVSVPVRDVGGELIGVLTADGLDRRMKRAGEKQFVDTLQAAAPEISQAFAENSDLSDTRP